MARMKPKAVNTNVLFDVFYEDGEEAPWVDFAYPNEPVRNPWRNVGRNDPCPCGSGKKFKKCCLAKGELPA